MGEFVAQFDTTFEGKPYKKGSILPYNARNIPGATLRLDEIVSIKETKPEKEVFKKKITKKKK